MCGAHAAVRSLVGELAAHDGMTIVDIEAGLEHLSRGTARHADRVLAIVEPYFKSMETAARVTELARELGVQRVSAVANKVRSEADRDALADYCARHGMELLGSVPDDDVVRESERRGVSPIDVNPESAAVAAITRLARALR